VPIFDLDELGRDLTIRIRPLNPSQPRWLVCGRAWRWLYQPPTPAAYRHRASKVNRSTVSFSDSQASIKMLEPETAKKTSRLGCVDVPVESMCL
jgi:hypothetical protein